MAIVGMEGLDPISLAVVEMVDPSKIDRLVCGNVLSAALPSPFSLSPSSSFVIHVVAVLAVDVVPLDVNEEDWSWSGLIETARGCSATASTVEPSIDDDEGKEVKEEGMSEAESSHARTAMASDACSDMSGCGSCCCWL